jgi:polyphosphate kinase 2 (PPK2 family)
MQNDPHTIPEKAKLTRKEYEEELRKLQIELCKLQEWVRHEGLRIIVIFEGRDAAGKGGAIKAITERVSPRVFRVAALPAPSDREKTQIYLQRYMQYFPAAGEIVIFDRSWYNRAGVEYVMGFCSNDQHKRFLQVCPSVEKYIVDTGIQLIKFWLKSATRNRSVALRRASRTRCGSGSLARWTCHRAVNGMDIPALGIRCSKPPIQNMHRGTLCALMISVVRG